MRNTYFKLWVHGIINTKLNHVPIAADMETLLHQEIEKRLIEQGCEVGKINGSDDHVHFLFTQNPLLSIHETVRFVQNLTQRWYQLNDKNTGWYKFAWEDGYHTYSVSESILNRVAYYIESQKQLHQKITFLEEMEHFNLLHKVDTREWVEGK
jgi:putative transposase